MSGEIQKLSQEKLPPEIGALSFTENGDDTIVVNTEQPHGSAIEVVRATIKTLTPISVGLWLSSLAEKIRDHPALSTAAASVAVAAAVVVSPLPIGLTSGESPPLPPVIRTHFVAQPPIVRTATSTPVTVTPPPATVTAPRRLQPPPPASPETAPRREPPQTPPPSRTRERRPPPDPSRTQAAESTEAEGDPTPTAQPGPTGRPSPATLPPPDPDPQPSPRPDSEPDSGQPTAPPPAPTSRPSVTSTGCGGIGINLDPLLRVCID